MKDGKLLLSIVTPDKSFFESEVDMFIVNTIEGEIGVLKGHMPLVTVLDIGKINIKKDGEERFATINMGFMQVGDNSVTIFTDSAEWPDEIDVNRAKEAQKRAEDRLSAKNADLDVNRAELALRRALNRIDMISSIK